jgi:phosphopantetheinyl transferase
LPPVRAAAGAGLGRRGLELAAVGRVLDAALQALDIRPDAVAGHSIGEWSALIAAGAAPFEEFADSTRAFDAGPGVPDMVFAALGCGAQAAVEAIGELPDVVLSHDNCPHQSIICGEQSQVAEVLARLRVGGVTGSVLPFRSGFHTPYLEPYLGPTREFVHGLTLRQAQVPLWSATTADRYPEDPDEVRRLLLRNLVEPVRFGPLIRRMQETGIRVFVQVGTGSLPGFVEDTLESLGTPHLALSANVPRRSGLQQLRRVAAALWAVGAAPAFGRLAGSTAQPHPAAQSAPTPGPAASARLRLGAPLIRDLGMRLDGPTRPPAITPGTAEPAVAWPAGDPVLAEYSAFLTELAGAATDVLAAARPQVVPANPVVADPEPAAASPAAASPAPPPSTGPRSRTSTRRLSLDTDPELADHSLLQAPADRPVAERFPVVPLTATVELLMAAAAELVPERRVIGLRGVRALRPLAVDPHADLVIEATEKEAAADPSVVTVVISGAGAGGAREPYARATVLLAADYPAPPALREPALIAERPAPIDATTLYADRWMFHGPAYQGVIRLTALAEDGVRGTVTALPAPGSLLDAAGQLLGYWVATQPNNGLVLPATVGSISFYAPPPTVGSQFETVVHVRSVAPEEVVADLDLRAADGSLWCHITGWTDRRLQGDARTIEAFRHPARAVLAQRQDDGWWLLTEPWTDPVARDLTCRQYLTPAERADHDARNPRAARRWLLGRIAAKDAVRSWLWDHGHGPLFPAQIVIGNDAAGRPYATGAGSEQLALSIAHAGGLAAAFVGPAGSAVGIDLELIEDAPAEAALLTAAERELLDTVAPAGHPDRASWVTRFWTAKEAVAKAGGTGLAGRPARFVVTSVDSDRLRVVVDGTAHWVRTRTGDNPVQFAVGWTVPSDMLVS